MSGSSDDLQQWLNSLKKRAESKEPQKGPPSMKEARPQPKARPVKRPRPTNAETPKSEEHRPQPMGGILGEFVHMLERASQAASRKELNRRAAAAASEEKARRLQEQKEVELRRERKLEEKRKALVEMSKKKAAADNNRKRVIKREHELREKRDARGKGKKRSAPRSALGLSGNLMRDLRNNPQALKEAILLVEILGPPLCDRDPANRLI